MWSVAETRNTLFQACIVSTATNGNHNTTNNNSLEEIIFKTRKNYNLFNYSKNIILCN